VREVHTFDGIKFVLADDSWLLIRPSGTEPVLRVYAEARDSDEVGALLSAGRALVGLEK
jgi:phosphomannomutase